MLEILLAPFRFEFMNEAFLITTLVAVPAALLSCFLVLKGWALLGDAVSHAVFPGVVLAYVLGWPLAVGAFLAGMFTAVATGYLGANSRIKQDTVMGVVFAGMFGLGVVMFVKVKTDVHLNHILFGNMLGVSWGDVVQTGAIALVVTGLVAFKWRDLLLYVFDPAQARAVGLRVQVLHYGLLALIALTIVAALQAVGIILAVAILIAPGAIAYLLCRTLRGMLVCAAAVAATAAFLGVYLSFFIDSDPAATVVLVLAFGFVVAFARSTVRVERLERGTTDVGARS